MATKPKSNPQGRRNRPLRRDSPAAAPPAVLFDRVVEILEQARAGVVRAVNSNMVLAYWLIGREIVQEIQGGKGRAAYGEQVLEDLSRNLTERYGPGFSGAGLRSFRQFYLVYSERLAGICYPPGSESAVPASVPKRRPAGRDFGFLGQSSAISRPLGSESLSGFSPQLSWSHYRALMRVEKSEAREFYEREAITGMWDKRMLERQIHSSYYERLLKSQQPEKMRAGGRQTLVSQEPAIESLKNPYVLEFLGLPEVAALQESCPRKKNSAGRSSGSAG